MRPNEYEAGRRGYFCIGAAVLANEDETCSSVHEDKSDRRTRPSFHRSHSDVEKFTDWLIKVLQSRLRTNFGRRRRKAAFLRARVDVRQRRFTRHAKLGSGHNDEVKVEFDRLQYKCGPCKDFSGQVSDPATGCIQCIAQSECIREPS